MILIPLSFCYRHREQPCIARTAPAPALGQCRSLATSLAVQTSKARGAGGAIGSGTVAARIGHNSDSRLTGSRGLGVGRRLLTARGSRGCDSLRRDSRRCDSLRRDSLRRDSLRRDSDIDGRGRWRRRHSDNRRRALGTTSSTIAERSRGGGGGGGGGGLGRALFGNDDCGGHMRGDGGGGPSLLLAASEGRGLGFTRRLGRSAGADVSGNGGVDSGAHGGRGGRLNARIWGWRRTAGASSSQGGQRGDGGGLRAILRRVRLVAAWEVHTTRSGGRGHGGQHAKCSNRELHGAFGGGCFKARTMKSAKEGMTSHKSLQTRRVWCKGAKIDFAPAR